MIRPPHTIRPIKVQSPLNLKRQVRETAKPPKRVCFGSSTVQDVIAVLVSTGILGICGLVVNWKPVPESIKKAFQNRIIGIIEGKPVYTSQENSPPTQAVLPEPQKTVNAKLGKNFAGQLLADRDMSDQDLRRSNLSGANLTLAVLTNAQLQGANLRGAILDLADLSKANLTNADLSDALLKEANLEETILTGAFYEAGHPPKTDIPPEQLDLIAYEGEAYTMASQGMGIIDISDN